MHDNPAGFKGFYDADFLRLRGLPIFRQILLVSEEMAKRRIADSNGEFLRYFEQAPSDAEQYRSRIAGRAVKIGYRFCLE